MIARDIMNGSGLPTELETTGFSREGDGGGMRWRVQGSAPDGVMALVSLPTADGQWAVPVAPPVRPPRRPNQAAAEDMIRRGFTFRDEGGRDLVWEGKGRAGPLWGGTPVHRRYSKPYPITCSHFTGMLMMGWEYSSTTYVVDTPRQVGWYVPLEGQTPAQAEIWQAHRQARLFYRRGDLWLSDGSDLERGDIVFFSQQDPEGQNAKVRAGENDAYFGNIYHVAQYLGGGQLLQAATPTSPTGVFEVPLSSLRSTLSWVARPAWVPPPGDRVRVSVWQGVSEVPLP